MTQVCWQQLFGKTALQILSGSGSVRLAGVLVVSQLCFGGCWCLVALWWCVRSVLTVFGDLGALLMFRWCLCGVSALFPWCLGVLKEWYFFD